LSCNIKYYSSGKNYIPIDFIKVRILGYNQAHFLNNNKLEFEWQDVNNNTGECETAIAKYKNMKLTLKGLNYFELQGSLHILANNGKHNYNDFTYEMFNNSLQELLSIIMVDVSDLRILKLEYGFNIRPPQTTDYVIDRLLQLKDKSPTKGKDCVNDGNYTQFKFSEYILKVYNKGLQHKLGFEVLRVEVKQTNWSKYRIENKISTIYDFIKSDKSIFINKLLDLWKEVKLYDIKYESEIANSYNLSCVNYWKGLNPNRVKKFREHRKLLSLNSKHGIGTQNAVHALMIEKYNKLRL
jgi:hypothetical protein